MLIDHLEKIKHFQGVVRYGSIRKYAIKENISQSAVSKSMQILETALDTPLFVRKRTGVELTQAGSEILKFSEDLTKMISETEMSIQSKSSVVLGGTLKMGSYQSISIYFMPKLLKFIKENQKNLKLDLYSDSSTNLIKKVKSKDFDLCISVNPNDSNGLENVVLYEDYYSFFKHKGAESSKDIYTYMLAQDAKGISVSDHVKPISNIYNFVSCSDFETAKAMLKEKLGYALLPTWVAQPLLDSGEIEQVKLSKMPASFGEHYIGLSYKKSRSSDQAIAWLSEQIKIMMGV
jgi:DNA-binding transcriptional LysR family regulator